ncbi:protein hinderin isoform X2 [Engystomops pustulosus]|uniref:protein hinderin isoform X2 n=1 Tax=Engystomops pustulosus TaxID=76066 RepID=UPI003AFB1731
MRALGLRRVWLGAGCWGAGGGGCLKMADVAGEGAAAYWSQDDSDEEQLVVYVPGLCGEGNCRPATKTKNLKAVCMKPGNPRPCAAPRMDLLSDWGQKHLEEKVMQPEAGIRSASLKDLCPEDKRRIANLIKELARVSEEKEVTEERLKTEHESFEKKIRHLEEQNNLIAAEREALQQQYRECQELLSLYQKYLSEQQEKLNPSVSEPSVRSSRPQQVCKTPRQPTASELDGSYLGQQNRKPNSESGSCLSAAPRPLCRSDPTPRNGCHYIPDRCSSENPHHSNCPGAAPHYTDYPCSQHCGRTSKPPLTHCCFHPTAHNPFPPELSLVRPHEDGSLSRCSTTSGRCNGERGKDSPRDRGISDQRRQELLLQKMEVEIEKERLQQLLVQQEVKLLEKQHQLQQARLQADRCQGREVAVMSTPLPGAVKLMNGSPGIPTPPSSKSRRKPQSPQQQHAEGRTSRSNMEGDGSYVRPQTTVSKGSRKDAATSPAMKPQKMEVKSAETSHQRRDLYRYETSLIDMLEAISPVSSGGRRPRQRELDDFSLLSPIPRSHPRSFQPEVRRREPPGGDPEESELLEEIFFIC